MAASLARLNSAASTHYYAKDNYYNHENGVANSSWFGKGSGYFGLSGAVEPLQFKNLMEGKDPFGIKYLAGVKPRSRVNVQSGKVESHRSGIDVTFAPPKSVSLAALLENKKDVEAAHRIAVDKTLTEIEKKLSVCRIGSRNERHNRLCGNLIVARFEHDVSRSKDPQLHTHCVIISAVRKPDMQWRRINNDVFWDNSKFINDFYLNQLKSELKKIDIPIVEKKDSSLFEIQGLDSNLLKLFSKQTEKIKKMQFEDQFKSELKYQIQSGRDELKAEKYVERKLKISKRDKKGKELSREELKNLWDVEKDGLLNINTTFERFKNDIIISSAGYFIEKALEGVEEKFKIKGLSSSTSAFSQILIGSEIHDASPKQELYRYSGSLVGGYLGSAALEWIGGPVGLIIGNLIGSEIGQDIAENVFKYFSYGEKNKILENKGAVDVKIKNVYFEDQNLIKENKIKNNNGRYEDMRQENKVNMKESEFKKESSQDLKFELKDHNREPQKDLGEKIHDPDIKREVAGVSQETEKKDKQAEHDKEIDYDNWSPQR